MAWLSQLRNDRLSDIRHAFRLWRKRPVVAAAAVLTIALGASLNIAVTEAIWTVMLKPLPYPHADRLVQIWVDDGKDERSAPGRALIDTWRDGSRTFAQIASYRPWRVTVASGGDPQQVYSGLVSAEFFGMLGARFVAGRPFSAQETRAGADDAIVLREGFWRQRFNADYGVLGRTIGVDGRSCRVIGIVSDSFSAAVLGAKSRADVYLPISRAQIPGMRVPTPMRTVFAIGRLRDGVSAHEAGQDLAAIAKAEEKRRIWLSPLQAELGRQVGPALLALLAATGCVLLIACANLANLLMAQGVMRRRELAVRSALGAGRGRLIRQLLTETGLVLVAGTLAGAVLARAVTHAMIAMHPSGLPRAEEAGPSWKIYAAASGVILLLGLAFGMLPAWRASRDTNESSLRVGGTLWMSRGSRRWADGMVAVQVGLTAVVLISAGVLLRSFLELRSVEIGVAREHVITASIDLPGARYSTREERARFGERWVERLQAMPGVAAAGISNSLPLRYTTLLHLLIRVPGSADEQMVAARSVSGAYFDAIGLRFVEGTAFDERRKDQVVVNEAFVRRFLKGKPSVGVALGTEKVPLLITGVVKDVRHRGLRDAAQPEVYMPFASFPLNPVDTVIRSSLPRAQVEAAMRRELRAVDDQLAVGRVMTMEDVVDEQLAAARFQAALLGLFATVALLLAAVGTYGVIAQTVRSRLPEMALRRTLGAGTGNLLRLVLVAGMKAPLLGLTIGVAAGVFVAGRALRTLLYGVAPDDPALVVGTAVVLGITAMAACLIPAVLAVRVQPGETLRQD